MREEQHLALAHANEEFLGEIRSTGHLDWTVTVLFYTALHYADAVLARFHSAHPTDHQDRARQLSSPSYSSLHDSYRRLQDRSRAARYEGQTPSPDEFAKLEGDLHKVRSRAVTLLGPR